MRKRLVPLFVVALTSCVQGTTHFDSFTSFPSTRLIEFDTSDADRSLYRISNGYTNGNMFASYWDHNRVRYENGVAYLSVVDKPDGKNYGAELRTNQGYLYGYFGARMKTFKHSGTVQSIFTYNGGWNRWDEIDIEFLGKDTTKVQFNYYCDGKGGHEYMHTLGFDSSEDFHEYGFKWEEKRITWYVDGKPVYAVDAELIQWGQFFLNVWAGDTTDAGIRRWLGDYEKTDTPKEAAYDYMIYAPLE